MKSAPSSWAAETVRRTRLLWQAATQRHWVRLYVIFLALFVPTTVAITLSPWRLGVDMQRLLGYPSCLPSLVYLIEYKVPHPPRIGDYAVFQFPETGYSVGPRHGQKTIKLVMAVPGDRVQVKGTDLYVRWAHLDRLWLAKSIPGKDVGDFDAEYIVPEGHFFAYGTEKESLDSRYFGPVDQRLIVGYARPLF